MFWHIHILTNLPVFPSSFASFNRLVDKKHSISLVRKQTCQYTSRHIVISNTCNTVNSSIVLHVFSILSRRILKNGAVRLFSKLRCLTSTQEQGFLLANSCTECGRLRYLPFVRICSLHSVPVRPVPTSTGLCNPQRSVFHFIGFTCQKITEL